MSLKKWICSFLARRAAPIECTGASPHLCERVSSTLSTYGKYNLVVESASLVEVFKEFHVGFASPEIEITYLEVAPDCADC